VRRELDRGEQALALAEAEVITTVGSDLQLQWRTLQSEREPATLAGSPTVRILVAWSQVEDALQKAQDYRARPDTDRPRAAVTYGNVKGIPGLLHHWIVADLTPASTVQVYRALATVRNALANGGSTGHPTEETARDYEEQATRLRNLILLADRREYPRPAEP
jgi:hypothetical protein